MVNSGKLRLVTDYKESLVTRLQSTKNADILNEISSRLGSLSAPSKMPGYSWSISTEHCITGSKLAKIAGTPCSKCYAQKGFYTFPIVKSALNTRLRAWQDDPDWVLLMSIRLLLINKEHFRWFDSGDIQSLKMLQDINQVALNTDPFVKHWLPSQERAFVSQLLDIAPNLIIRLSSTKIGSIQSTQLLGICTSSISKEKIPNQWNCPSSTQDNKCLDCRACWNKQITNVVYIEH